ncbi:MAG: hypothetical protein M1482_04040 [Chloroflexi bacterium]|nr:hypothetical protein [Chloroflexota bacterium]
MVEVIVSVVKPEDREVFGGLEDARDGHTRGSRVVERRRGGATGEALRLHVAARIEDNERFRRHT